MKLCVVLLHVAAILYIAGFTLGDEVGGCPITEGIEANKLTGMLKEGFNECFGNVGGLDLEILKKEMEPGSMSTSLLVEFCRRGDLVKNCISTVTTRYSTCLNESQLNQFVLLEDFLKSTFSFGCLDNGEHLAFVINYMFGKDNTTAERNDVKDCMAITDTTDVDGSSMIGLYREFKVFKECFIRRMRGFNPAVYSAKVMLNGIMRSMKCMNPDDGSEVNCGTIVTSSSTEEKACPYEGSNEDEPPGFEKFFVFGARCTTVNLHGLDLDHLRNSRTYKITERSLNYSVKIDH